MTTIARGRTTWTICKGSIFPTFYAFAPIALWNKRQASVRPSVRLSICLSRASGFFCWLLADGSNSRESELFYRYLLNK